MTPADRDPELDFHIEMLTRRYVEEGLDPEAARQKALMRVGPVDLRPHQAPRPSASWLRSLGQDLMHAARVLRRSPAFVVLTTVMLAFGAGASTAVFSVVDGVLLRAPLADMDAVVSILVRQPDGQLSALTYEHYERLAAHRPPALAALGADDIASPVATRIDVSKRTQTVCLSADMPAVLGTSPLLGRWFTPEEARTGAAVAVVSFNFWRQSLGGTADAVGRVIALDATPVTIIGVMPAGFDGPYPRLYREIWVPYTPGRRVEPSMGCPVRQAAQDRVSPLARLNAEIPLDAATQQVNAALNASDIVLRPYAEDLVGDLRSPFLALVGAVLAVLLIAFANVTNLGLERLAGRRRELAIRLALGATRTRVIRETVAEHVVVALAGATLGIGLAYVSFDAIMALLPQGLPNVDAVSLNQRVLAASLALAVCGGVVSGLVSAWQASAEAVRGGLASGERGNTGARPRIRKILVAGELALGVLLMVAALLMIRTFVTLRPSDPGFDPGGKYMALVRLPPETTAAERVRFHESLRARLLESGGVRAVAATTSVPMRRSRAVLPADIAGTRVNVDVAAVTPNYFDLMGIPLRGGRPLTDADEASSGQVAVVNEAFARRWFDGQSPLGSTVTLRRGTQAHPVTIVGIVGDIRSSGSDTRIRPFVFTPLRQSILGNAFVAIHPEPRAAAGLPALMRSAVDRVQPGLLVDEIEPLLDEMHAEVAQPRLGAWLFGLFAALAVLLAAVGLAATLAWSVAQRRREIGVRMALGAQPRDVRNLILGQMLRLSIAGVATGLLAAAASTRLLAGWLYGVAPLDPSTFAVCGVAMLIVASLATYVPTRRAVRIDPVVALRGDAS